MDSVRSILWMAGGQTLWKVRRRVAQREPHNRQKILRIINAFIAHHDRLAQQYDGVDPQALFVASARHTREPPEVVAKTIKLYLPELFGKKFVETPAVQSPIAERVAETVTPLQAEPTWSHDIFQHIYAKKISAADEADDRKVVGFLQRNDIASMNILRDRALHGPYALDGTGGEFDLFRKRIKALGLNEWIQTGRFHRKPNVTSDAISKAERLQNIKLASRDSFLPAPSAKPAPTPAPAAAEAVDHIFDSFAEAKLAELNIKEIAALRQVVKFLHKEGITAAVMQDDKQYARDAWSRRKGGYKGKGQESEYEILLRLAVLRHKTLSDDFLKRLPEIAAFVADPRASLRDYQRSAVAKVAAL